VAVLYTVTAPVVDQQRPMKPLAVELGRRLRPGDQVIGYRIGMPTSLIYYSDHPVIWINDPATLRERLCAPGRMFLVTTGAEPAASSPALDPPLVEVAARGDLVVREKPSEAACRGAV